MSQWSFLNICILLSRFGVEHIDLSMLSTPSKLMSTVQGSLGMLTFHWQWCISVFIHLDCYSHVRLSGDLYFVIFLCAEFLGHYRTFQSLPKPSSAIKMTTWCLRRFAGCGDYSRNRRWGLYWGPVVHRPSHLSADS